MFNYPDDYSAAAFNARNADPEDDADIPEPSYKDTMKADRAFAAMIEKYGWANLQLPRKSGCAQ